MAGKGDHQSIKKWVVMGVAAVLIVLMAPILMIFSVFQLLGGGATMQAQAGEMNGLGLDVEVYKKIGEQYGVAWSVLAALHQSAAPAMAKGEKGSSATKYSAYINAAAAKENLDPNLIRAVIKKESSFNPKAYNKKSQASGLMQLVPSTAKEMGVRDIFDPYENIMGGSKYLRMMIDRYDDVDLGLAAYNAGPGNVDKNRSIPNFKETQEYVPLVKSYWKQFAGGKISDGGGNTKGSVVKVAQMLAKLMKKHESKKTKCMTTLQDKKVPEIKSGKAGNYGVLSCALYEYTGSWSETAVIEQRAKELEKAFQEPKYTGGKMLRPSNGTFSSHFGPRGGGFHTGVDFAGPIDSPIFAAGDGTVSLVRHLGNQSYGSYIVIDHGGGVQTLYAHMEEHQVLVSQGDKVTRGQQIGGTGNNGNSTGPHLHFEVKVNGKPVNPSTYLNLKGRN